MKNLILIRHAKSSWNASFKDFDRPIVQLGSEDAQLVATSFSTSISYPVIIYSSSAKRCQQTASIFANTILYPSKDIVFRDSLYTFDENKLEEQIRTLTNMFNNVILFGHNDAITNFVNKFGNVLIDNVPTSGLVWLQFQTDSWETIDNGIAKKIIFPKSLK